jgi:hypothetical protein
VSWRTHLVMEYCELGTMQVCVCGGGGALARRGGRARAARVLAWLMHASGGSASRTPLHCRRMHVR